MITWWNNLTLVQQILALFALPATVILAIQTILLLFGIGSGHGTDAHGADSAGSDLADSHGFDAAHAPAGHEADLAGGSYTDSVMAPDTSAGMDTLGHGGDIHDLASHPGEHPAAHTDIGLRLITVRGLVGFFAVGGWVGIALIDLKMPALLASFLALVAGLLALVLIAWIFKLVLSLQSSGNLDLNGAIGLTGQVYLRIPGSMRGTGKITLTLQERLVELDVMTNYPETIGTGQLITVTGRKGDVLLVEPLNADKSQSPGRT